jgi:ATP-dependent Clp protease ATP-binding subunit ClpA
VPTFSSSLEKALHQALTLANERHHEYATLEHLLLALIDDADAAAWVPATSISTNCARS